MDVGIIFIRGGEFIQVRVSWENVLFSTPELRNGFVPIDSLYLSKQGVVKEFPDLKDDENWKSKAIERFKNHVKGLKNEMERVKYVIDELKKHGYIPKYMQRQGFRVEKIK